VRRPPLDVRRPSDQRFAVPKADRLAIPTRHVGAEPRHGALLVELPADMDVRDVVARRRRQDLHELRRHHDLVHARAREVEAAHEALGPAVHTGPLRGVRRAFVKHLLDHPGLILVGQQREDRRNLVPEHAVPSAERRLDRDAAIPSVPLERQLLAGLLRGAAAPPRVGEQRRVVRFGRLEGVRAHDRLARIVALTVAPGRRLRPRQDRHATEVARPALLLDGQAAVAAEVARIAPQGTVAVEVCRREDVDGKRRDAGRRGAVECGADIDRLIAGLEAKWADNRVVREVFGESGRGALGMRQFHQQRRAAADSLRGLRARLRGDQRGGCCRDRFPRDSHTPPRTLGKRG